MPDYGDDYLVNNSVTQEKMSHDINVEALGQPNPMLNKFSTKKGVYRDIVLDEDQITQLAGKNYKRTHSKGWRNW